MKILVLGFLVMSMGLASCGWKEDALDGKKQGTQEAVPPSDEKPVPRPGDFDQLLRITTSVDTFRFMEEQKRKYVINGAVLVDGAEFVLSVENLSDFPEADGKFATFDRTTGIFAWTPPLGFVETNTEKKMQLKVTIATVPSTTLPVQRIGTKEIEVRITPANKLPQIESVTFNKNKQIVREGEILDFDVVVRDTTAKLDAPPMLKLLPVKDNDLEGASVVEMNPDFVANPEIKDPKDPYAWTFHMRVDLRSREITASQVTLHLNMVAISNFKQESPVTSTSFDVWTNLRKPQFTWKNPWTFKAGQMNYNTFMVFDPRGEGRIGVKYSDCSKIHPNLICGTCTSNYESGFETLQCSVAWDIPGDYFTKGGKEIITVPFKISIKSKIYGDVYNLPDTAVNGVINILHVDAPPAPPNPIPTPVPVVGDN